MKVYKVTGEIKKPNLETSFIREVIATKPKHAIERVYSELGSKHRVKRFQISILDVNEVPIQEIKSPLLKKLVSGE